MFELNGALFLWSHVMMSDESETQKCETCIWKWRLKK